ncbi:MAG: hypothetical protein K2X55_01115 [Burkholderiaceae bacterium]|nr:hypothetical protein [Burkholderiaceae bacterium]
MSFRLRRKLPPGRVPMTSPARNRLALELATSVETLLAQPSPGAFNQVSKMLAALAGAGMKSPALDQASNTMNLICDRYERVGKVGASADEAAALRAAIAGIDQALPRLAVDVLARAVAEVEAFCALAGA